MSNGDTPVSSTVVALTSSSSKAATYESMSTAPSSPVSTSTRTTNETLTDASWRRRRRDRDRRAPSETVRLPTKSSVLLMRSLTSTRLSLKVSS